LWASIHNCVIAWVPKVGGGFKVGGGLKAGLGVRLKAELPMANQLRLINLKFLSRHRSAET